MKLYIVIAVAALTACSSKSEKSDKAEDRPISKKAASVPPPAVRVPVTDEYHGEKVVDEYRWLETWSDPKVQAWTRAQDKHTRAVLAALPSAAAIKKRVREVLAHPAVSYGAVAEGGKSFFALKHQPPKKQDILVRLPSLTDLSGEKVVLDPNALDPSGSTTIDFYRPSPDGKLVAVSLSKGGSEAGDVHVYEVATGKQVHEVIPRVNGGTAGGDLVWSPDGRGFYYTRYPRGEERPAADRNFYTQVYFHALGKPTGKDRYEIGKDFPRIAEIELTMHRPTGRLLATVQKGDGGEFAHYLRSKKGAWTQLTEFGDRHVQIAFGPGTDLLVLSRKGAARGKVLRMRAGSSVDKAKTLIPEGKDNLVDSFWGTRSLVLIKDRILATYQLGGPSELRLFDLAGKRVPGPEQLPSSAAGAIVPLPDGTALFANGSYTTPAAYFHFDPKSGKTEKTALVDTAPIDLSKVKVERVFATSKDGTKVPVNILIPPGAKRDGTTPAMVTAYGGYGISLAPHYSPRLALWLEQGIIVAVANLRGGGEYGETWHLQGNLTNKQNVFDDFAAVLSHMAAEKYTSADRIIIQGGSNGGLLMGATLVQHPELMKAVVSHVGIYDMLRVELSPNGAFNVTEFGTVKNPEQFKALYAYSPYHHVEDGKKYPPVFLLTGANDPRVDPMQSRKFAARLQAATKNATPVLLRVSFSTGHGRGTPLDERVAQTASVLAFSLHQLGRPFRAP